MISGKLLRSIVKTITYRIVGSILILILVYIMTGELAISVGVGVADMLIKSLLFFGHEYLWEHTALNKWGKPK